MEVVKIVDATEAAQSPWVNAELVAASPTKKAVVIEEGEYKKGNYGRKLELGVSIDAKLKTYTPSRTTAQRLINAWGADTTKWVQKTIDLRLETGKTGQAVVEGHPASESEVAQEKVPDANKESTKPEPKQQVCESCKKPISDDTFAFTMKKYGAASCRDCEEKLKEMAEEAKTQKGNKK